MRQSRCRSITFWINLESRRYDDRRDDCPRAYAQGCIGVDFACTRDDSVRRTTALPVRAGAKAGAGRMTPIPSERRPDDDSARLFKDDTRFALGRIAVFQYLAVGIFLLLISGFWILQVRDHEANSDLAERNRIKTVPLH